MQPRCNCCVRSAATLTNSNAFDVAARLIMGLSVLVWSTQHGRDRHLRSVSRGKHAVNSYAEHEQREETDHVSKREDSCHGPPIRPWGRESFGEGWDVLPAETRGSAAVLRKRSGLKYTPAFALRASAGKPVRRS